MNIYTRLFKSVYRDHEKVRNVHENLCGMLLRKGLGVGGGEVMESYAVNLKLTEYRYSDARKRQTNQSDNTAYFTFHLYPHCNQVWKMILLIIACMVK